MILLDTLLTTIIDGLGTAMKTGGNYETDLVTDVLDRYFTNLDRGSALCVIPGDGAPTKDYQMGQFGPSEWSWPVMIGVLVKSADETTGRRTRSRLMSRVIREVYRLNGLGGGIRGLTLTDDGVTEYVKRCDIAATRIVDAEIKKGNWQYLGAVDLEVFTQVEIT